MSLVEGGGMGEEGGGEDQGERETGRGYGLGWGMLRCEGRGGPTAVAYRKRE